MSAFLLDISVRYVDEDGNELDRFDTCADGSTAAWCHSMAESELGSNVRQWMDEKEAHR